MISRFISWAFAGLIAAATLAGGMITGLASTAQAGPLHSAQAGPLHSGPYTCKSGFVWRDAVPGDLVCVTPQARDVAANENAAAPSRRSPTGGAWGPATCKSGFVWREARPSDLACVPVASRDRVRGENGFAAVRNLVDPGATPRGGLTLRTEQHQLCGFFLYVSGGGLSPNGTVSFYAVGANWQGPRSLTSATTNFSGAVGNNTYVGEIRAEFPRRVLEHSTIVVHDRSSGMVTTAGTTSARIC